MSVWHQSGESVSVIVEACGKFWTPAGWSATPQLLPATELFTVGDFSQYGFPVESLQLPDGCSGVQTTYFAGDQVLSSGCSCGDLAALLDAALCKLKVVRMAPASSNGCGSSDGGCGDPECSSCG